MFSISIFFFSLFQINWSDFSDQLHLILQLAPRTFAVRRLKSRASWINKPLTLCVFTRWPQHTGCSMKQLSMCHAALLQDGAKVKSNPVARSRHRSLSSDWLAWKYLACFASAAQTIATNKEVHQQTTHCTIVFPSKVEVGRWKTWRRLNTGMKPMETLVKMLLFFAAFFLLTQSVIRLLNCCSAKQSLSFNNESVKESLSGTFAYTCRHPPNYSLLFPKMYLHPSGQTKNQGSENTHENLINKRVKEPIANHLVHQALTGITPAHLPLSIMFIA